MLQRFNNERLYLVHSRLRCDHLLWSFVLLAAVGDLVLTLVGLSLCFSEANPLARALLDAGGGVGLVALKMVAVGVLLAVYRYVRPLYRRAALVAFSVPQLLAVGHNGLLIARHAEVCL